MVGFLKEHLGLDLTAVMNWLSYIFDSEKTRQTHNVRPPSPQPPPLPGSPRPTPHPHPQHCRAALLTSMQVLIKFFNGSVIATKGLIGKDEKNVSRLFDDVENSLSSVIKDPRHQPKDSDASPAVLQIVFDALSWIFHNPIAQKLMEYNPLTIATQAAEEGITAGLDELNADIKFPSLNLEPVLAIITKFIEEEGEQLQEFLTLLSESLPKIIETPSKVLDILEELAAGGLWTLLESARNLVVSLMELIMASFDVVLDLINQVMKLDWISDLWDDFTGVPLTTLNLFTWPVAAIWNLVSLILTGEFPFGSDGNAGHAGLIDELLAWDNPDTTAAPVQPRALRAEATVAAAAATASSGEASEPQPRAAGMKTMALDKNHIRETYPRIMNIVNSASQCTSWVSVFVSLLRALGSHIISPGRRINTSFPNTERIVNSSPVSLPSSSSGEIRPLVIPSTLRDIQLCAILLGLGGRSVGVVLNEIYLDATPAGTLSAQDIRISRARNSLPYGTAILDFAMRFATACLGLSGKIQTDKTRKGLDLACVGVAALSEVSCLIANIMAINPSSAPDGYNKVSYAVGAVAAGAGAWASASEAIIIAGGENEIAVISAGLGDAVSLACSLGALIISNAAKQGQ